MFKKSKLKKLFGFQKLDLEPKYFREFSQYHISQNPLCHIQLQFHLTINLKAQTKSIKRFCYHKTKSKELTMIHS